MSNITKYLALQIAIKAINNIASPNSIILTLLVFSTYSWINTYNLLLTTIIEYTIVIYKAIKEVLEL